MALKPIEGQELPNDCWTSTFPQTEVKDHMTSSELTCGEHAKSLSRCLFSKPSCHSKSVAIQILQDSGLTLIPLTSRKPVSWRTNYQPIA